MNPIREVKSSTLPVSVRTELVYLLAGALVFLLCVVISRPFAGSGFVDDWSYSYVALQLAKTGHFHYSGWGSPSIALQCLWAEPWIRMFGFSFNLLRLISLPFSLGFVLLTYVLGRRIGLSPSFALFGTLIVGTSPLFLPLAASFMTEPYACFLTVLGIYAAICAAESSNPRRAGMWLWILTLASILGGSDRQTVWIVPFSLLPYLLWKRRAERLFCLQAIAAMGLTLVSLAVVVKNFSPAYAPTALSKHQLIALVQHEGFYTIRRIVSVFLVALFLSLPALLPALSLWKTLTRRQLYVIVALTILILPFLLVGRKGMVPFLGDILTVNGILQYSVDGLGFRPTLLHWPLQVALTALLVLLLVTWALLVRSHRFSLDLFRRPAGIVMLISICAYAPLLIPPGLVDFIFDRYAMHFFPLVALSLLWILQTRVTKLPGIAYACLVVFAAYGIVTTHDYYAALRARIEAADALRQRGVPAAEISAGFEHDGWSELTLAGKIGTLMYGEDFSDEKFWFWYFTPHLKHRYVAVVYRLSNRVKNPVLQIPFTTWTYPFHRKAVIVKDSDL